MLDSVKKTGQLILMDEKLIELLEDLSDSQNDDEKILNVMLKRCMKAPISELKIFFEELSQALHRFPKVYLPSIQTLVFHFRNNSSRTILRPDLQDGAMEVLISEVH
ncbi:15502_t:CDS:2, partial [Racocetra fulgida]